MKTLIIASGNCGTTLKTAEILSEKIGGADIFDTLSGSPPDFSKYDVFVFGTNIRMFMLNGRFKKWSRKLRSYYGSKAVYGYLIGCAKDNGKALEKVSNKLPGNKGVVYAWGELPEDRAKGMDAAMYKSMKQSCTEKGEQPPKIREEELDKLARLIRG